MITNKKINSLSKLKLNFLFFLKKAKIYNFAKNIYYLIKFRNIKYLFYDIKSDLKKNINLLEELKLNKDNVIKKLYENNLNFFDENLSWHYHIFSGLEKNNVNILEVGTHIGEFTLFLSKIFKNSNIVSIDLKQNNDEFLLKKFNRTNDFIEKRTQNISKSNITFKEMNSIELLNNFEKDFFDIIFLDGDHTNPQVSMDVLSCYYILKKNGILISDDLNLKDKQNSTNPLDGYLPIKYLTEMKKLKTYYFIKRIRKSNSFGKSFISFSIKVK